MRRFPQSRLASALIAALFAWHPLHVESVAWVSERKDLLSTFFLLIALHFYFDFAKSRFFKDYLCVIALFGCALMCKPMVVTLPGLLLLLDRWPLRRFATGAHGGYVVGRIWLEKIPLLLMSIVIAIVTLVAQVDLGLVPSVDELSISFRITNAVESVAFYLAKMLVPTGLGVGYPFPEGFAVSSVLVSLALFVGMGALAFKFRYTRPYVAFGWMWYLITLLPVLGLIQTSGQARADRYSYLALLGVFVTIVWSLDECVRQSRKVILSSIATLAITVCVLRTWDQIGCWKDSESLFRHAVSVTRKNGSMHLALANSVSWEQNPVEAQYHFGRAIDAAPESYRVYESLAKYHEGRRELRLEVINLRKSLMWKPGQPALLNRLAYILAVHPDDSVRIGNEATRLAGFACSYDLLDNPDYRHTLAAALAETGDIEGAVRLSEVLLGEEGRPQTAGYRVRLARYRLGLPYRDPFLPDY